MARAHSNDVRSLDTHSSMKSERPFINRPLRVRRFSFLLRSSNFDLFAIKSSLCARCGQPAKCPILGDSLSSKRTHIRQSDIYLALISRCDVWSRSHHSRSSDGTSKFVWNYTPIKPLALHARHSTAKHFNLCEFLLLPPPPLLSVPRVNLLLCSTLAARIGSHSHKAELS